VDSPRTAPFDVVDAVPVDHPVTTPWPWTVVVPVKGGPAAKSRLSPLGARRLAVAAAVAADTMATLRSTSRVSGLLVVTRDPQAAATAEALGALIVTEPAAGLDAAVAAGLRVAPRHRPCAVVLADLPALRPADVADVLDRCAAALLGGAVRVVVPDVEGDGTVLMAGGHPAALHPSFGPGSAARHASGGLLLPILNDRVRRDVDTPDDLSTAVRLGVGPATRAALGDIVPS
jgi:2-phospho-L-lactate guanylyltransferase